MGARVGALHRSRGVKVIQNDAVARAQRSGNRVELQLEGVNTLRADLVVVGVGMRPATDWLGTAPIVWGGPVVTDEWCRTAVPEILAAGDCAAWTHLGYGEFMHVQHWDTAARHGVAAALSVVECGQRFMPVPFFWSDQHDVKLQLIGRTEGHDWVEIEDLDPPRAWSGITDAMSSGGISLRGCRRRLPGHERSCGFESLRCDDYDQY